LPKVECRKHNNPVGGGRFVSAWSRIGASHSNFFHLRLRIDVLFPERALVADDLHGYDGARRRRALCLLADVDYDTLSVPGHDYNGPVSLSYRSSTTLLQQNAPDFRSPSRNWALFFRRLRFSTVPVSGWRQKVGWIAVPTKRKSF
jgi:hypothetical protein